MVVQRKKSIEGITRHNMTIVNTATADYTHLQPPDIVHCESKKGATLTMAITLSILDRFAKFFHCCKQQEISYKTDIRLPITP